MGDRRACIEFVYLEPYCCEVTLIPPAYPFDHLDHPAITVYPSSTDRVCLQCATKEALSLFHLSPEQAKPVGELLVHLADGLRPPPLLSPKQLHQQHIDSPEWQIMRRFMLAIAGHRCQMCNAGPKDLIIHHRTYERLGHELPEDLIVLCRPCHNWFHQGLKVAGDS